MVTALSRSEEKAVPLLSSALSLRFIHKISVNVFMTPSNIMMDSIFVMHPPVSLAYWSIPVGLSVQMDSIGAHQVRLNTFNAIKETTNAPKTTFAKMFIFLPCMSLFMKNQTANLMSHMVNTTQKYNAKAAYHQSPDCRHTLIYIVMLKSLNRAIHRNTSVIMDPVYAIPAAIIIQSSIVNDPKMCSRANIRTPMNDTPTAYSTHHPANLCPADP